ncbi:MAG TPA: nucleotide pyrophosphohydrolase [Tepidisphaeraceae bacterium]|jgi:NTP pyrophosphatase (non-canonical NTP hydrolase)
MNQTTLAHLLESVRKFRDARDWKQFHNPKDLALTLVLEATEVLEHMQWRNGQELGDHLKKRHKEVAHELADVLHVLLLLAEDLDVDLVKAFDQKMRLNRRKYPVRKARGSAKKYTEL